MRRTTNVRRTTRCRTAPPRSASGRGPGRGRRGSGTTRGCSRGRPAQRRRPLSVLDGRGDRGRPRQPPARLPRRDRELAARLQHRHDRPHRQRLPRRRGAHRRQPPVEPPRRDGDRPLPARAAPRDRRRARGVPARAPRRPGCAVRRGQPARLAAPGDDLAAAPGLLPVRPGGPGLSDAAREACDATFSIAQFGSTRSINASAAGAIAMHSWVRQHADLSGEDAWRG